jgi:chorismate synthase
MNTFGNKFRITLWGESHTPSIGVTIEGVPSGIAISQEDFLKEIDRRRPCAKGTTARKESDIPIIIRGIENGVTTGTSIQISFENKNIRPTDYSQFAEIPRPSHADMVRLMKYPKEEFSSGGGVFSGRMTLPLVAAGVIAKKIIAPIEIETNFSSLGKISIPQEYSTNPWDYPPFANYIESIMAEGDSIGGVVKCTCNRVPAGIGEPFFESLESRISQLIFSIPGIRGIEFGDGFSSARRRGSENNDPIATDGKRIYTTTNRAGGILGGMSNGMPIVFRCAMKPTPSIFKEQDSVNMMTMTPVKLSIKGRHDPCIAVRAVPVIEAAAAIAVCDLLFDRD